MTIGTPYNLEESNPDNRTQMLNNLITIRNKLPSSLTVYSIAGTENLDGDGTVPIESVEAGKYIFQTRSRTTPRSPFPATKRVTAHYRKIDRL